MRSLVQVPHRPVQQARGMVSPALSPTYVCFIVYGLWFMWWGIC